MDESDLLRESRTDNLLGRWARPIEMAYPILWLASDEASFVTGATLMVDGGRSII
jgi:2-hydroxycyclohexanecarboxyl-CoA dehydrogenase